MLNYGFQDYGMLYAEHFISASLASLIFMSYPILMLIFLPIINKEKVSRYQIAALGLGFLGICFILTEGGASVGSMNAFGVLLVIAVALATALSLSLAKRYVVDVQNAILFFNLFSLAMFSVAFLVAGAPMSPLTGAEMFSVLYTGVVYSVIFAFLYYAALNTLKTTIVTNFYFLVPFITFALVRDTRKPDTAVLHLAAVIFSGGILIQKLDRREAHTSPRGRESRVTRLCSTSQARSRRRGRSR